MIINMTDKVATVAQDILKRDGHVTATSLLHAAKSTKSPAHEAFEWDDSKAGHQYRLIQARHYLRQIRVEVQNGETTTQRLVWVAPAAPSEGEEPQREGFYKPIQVVAQNPDEFARALVAAKQTLESAQRAAAELLEAAEASDAKERRKFALNVRRALAILSEILERGDELMAA